MGNCFGSSASAAVLEPPTAAAPQKAPGKSSEQKYVTAKVLGLRSQAETYHGKVVDCAKRAQQEYKSGDKKKAHDFSEQKTEWQRKRDEANRQASKAITAGQPWKVNGEIDLHGLFLEEALSITKEFLRHWGKQRGISRKEFVLIITGIGNHSKDNRSVIRPKVEELLVKERLNFEATHGGGAFRVQLKALQ